MQESEVHHRHLPAAPGEVECKVGDFRPHWHPQPRSQVCRAVSSLSYFMNVHVLPFNTFFDLWHTKFFCVNFVCNRLFDCVHQIFYIGSAAIELLVHNGAGDCEHHHDHHGHQRLPAWRCAAFSLVVLNSYCLGGSTLLHFPLVLFSYCLRSRWRQECEHFVHFCWQGTGLAVTLTHRAPASSQRRSGCRCRCFGNLRQFFQTSRAPGQQRDDPAQHEQQHQPRRLEHQPHGGCKPFHPHE